MTQHPTDHRPRITLSVVSHGHGQQVLDMMQSFIDSGLLECWQAQAIVTLNIPEPELWTALHQMQWPFPVLTLQNAKPKGFGANHNQASQHADSPWFCVVNPDVRWCPVETAQARAAALALASPTSATSIGLYCPTQITEDGALQDYARKLPTPWGIAARWAARRRNGRTQPGVADSVGQAQWVNGACMLFLLSVYRQLGGFNERYFMYCEDVDICLRLQLRGYQLAALPITVVHHAQRNTGRQLRHLYWHICSLCKLWGSASFWRYWRYCFTRRLF